MLMNKIMKFGENNMCISGFFFFLFFFYNMIISETVCFGGWMGRGGGVAIPLKKSLISQLKTKMYILFLSMTFSTDDYLYWPFPIMEYHCA